jgi:hypothetical protein
VVAGDNLFQPVARAVRAPSAASRTGPVLGVLRRERATRNSGQEVRHRGARPVRPGPSFTEKPERPETTLHRHRALLLSAAPAFPSSVSTSPRATIPTNRDGLMQWLCPRIPVLAWPVPGIWYDIGSKETLTKPIAFLPNGERPHPQVCGSFAWSGTARSFSTASPGL